MIVLAQGAGGDAVIIAFCIAAIASAMPVLLAAAGETLGEQAGVLNLGLEGLLLVGGYVAFVATLTSGSFWFGFVCGALAGAALSAVMMVLAVWLQVNQIVVGIGITLVGTGLTSMWYDAQFSGSRPRLGTSDSFVQSVLAGVPVVGPVLAAQPPVLYVAILAVVLVALFLQRTLPGLRLRTVGQRPEALDAAGGNVTRMRSYAVLSTGAFAGFGGAYLALVSAGTFTPGMTHGMGFLAIVTAMLARGSMLWVAVIALTYGVISATGTALQLTAIQLPNDLVTMAPFVAVMLALIVFGGSVERPPALTVPYVRGER
jgi:ABC-type uncharacterized transport system permease subunit